MVLNDISVSNGTDTCNLFASYFSSTYIKPSDHIITPTAYPSNINCIGNIYISHENILKYLKGLDTHKGAGPDAIPPYFVSKCAMSLSLPLFIIINKSMTTGLFPTAWKVAKVVPIFKSGNKETISNYRPISILSVFAKSFEALIYPYLKSHSSQLFIDEQHGFISSQLLVV